MAEYVPSPIGEGASQHTDVNVTNVELLQQTKQYLQSLLQRRAPDTILTHAWDEFYRIYSDLVRRFVITRGLRGADVDDCVQDVWSTVALKLTEFERPSERPGLRSWLYTVVRSRTADFLRRNQRRNDQSLGSTFDSAHAPCSREPDPGAALEQEWQQALLRTALEELRERVSQRSYRVLEMRLLDDRSEADTAAALGMTVEQVRYRKHRAQRKLQTLLAVYTGDALG